MADREDGMADLAPHRETRALITGAAQGLGLAVAEVLAEQGCRHMVLADRNVEAGQAEAARLAANGINARFVAVDMADLGSVSAMFEAAAAEMGQITALVNAAASTERGGLLDATPELWARIFDTNTRGPFFALQDFAKRAIAAGHGGGVVNILSIVVHGGLPFIAPYAASKSALLTLTKNAAHTLADHGIRVNGINVGWMDTPGEDVIQRKYHGRQEGWLAEAERSTPFGRLVKPQDVARQVAFLLGPLSGVVTGSVMDFDQRVMGMYPDTGEG